MQGRLVEKTDRLTVVTACTSYWAPRATNTPDEGSPPGMNTVICDAMGQVGLPIWNVPLTDSLLISLM